MTGLVHWRHLRRVTGFYVLNFTTLNLYEYVQYPRHEVVVTYRLNNKKYNFMGAFWIKQASKCFIPL